MGFFQDLKEDLSQAVSEITAEDRIRDKRADKIKEKEAISEDDVFAAAEESMGLGNINDMVDDSEGDDADVAEALSAFLDQVAANAEEAEYQYEEPKTPAQTIEEMNMAAKAMLAGKKPVREPVSFEKEEPVSYGNDTYAKDYYERDTYSSGSYSESSYSDSSYGDSSYRTQYAEEKVVEQATDEVAVITANMVVNGDITSTGSLEVLGIVKGNVKVLGELNITGGVSGNAQAANIIVTNAEVDGDLISSGSIKIGSRAVIRGNVYATSAVISGAIKGDIDVHGPVVLDSTAIVYGNIKSKAVQINNGAAIEGMCSQVYAEVSPSSFFN